jgi:type VI secretion system protein ImpA
VAVLDLDVLTSPIEEASPCGDDLEAEDDDNFLNFMSASEMVLPDRYFVEDHEGNRKPFFTDDRFQDLNLGANVATAVKLLGRTRDLRLLGLTAKLSIFDRKLDDFAIAVEAMATLLERFWDSVHPSADSGLRIGEIERLNEPFTVVTALNNTPLLRSKRFGTITRQSYLAAVRDSGGQDEINTGAVDHILVDENKGDLGPVVALQMRLAGLAQALARIRAICIEKAPAQPPDLGRIMAAVASIRAMLDRINPTAAPDGEAEAEGSSEEAAPSVAAGGLFSSTRVAARALAAATGYLAATEPSSPAVLLLRQAQALVGKSFLDALESLLPDHVRRATLSVASLPVFDMPVTQIAEKGAAFETSRDDEDSEADEDEAASLPAIASRGDALALLDRVAAHYRAVEPSSPVPILVERARSLVGKDFVTLITSMLPEAVLRGD